VSPRSILLARLTRHRRKAAEIEALLATDDFAERASGRVTKTTIPARPVIGPDGTVYQSLTAAAAAVGMDVSTIFRRLQRGNSGWRYAEPATSVEPPP
jgi:hypothetical protein